MNDIIDEVQSGLSLPVRHRLEKAILPVYTM